MALYQVYCDKWKNLTGSAFLRDMMYAVCSNDGITKLWWKLPKKRMLGEVTMF
jgi:hypothetical protein